MIPVIELPLASEEWIYPCSAADLRERLTMVPEADLNGLRRLLLAPSTRKDHAANGRYGYSPEPEIRIYSYPRSLRVKLLAGTRPKHLAAGFEIERRYGMEVGQVGSRYFCCWEPEGLRRFIVQHVLLHEIGHHVYHQQRRIAGYVHRSHTVEAEQFAEAYALRNSRDLGPWCGSWDEVEF